MLAIDHNFLNDENSILHGNLRQCVFGQCKKIEIAKSIFALCRDD